MRPSLPSRNLGVSLQIFETPLPVETSILPIRQEHFMNHHPCIPGSRPTSTLSGAMSDARTLGVSTTRHYLTTAPAAASAAQNQPGSSHTKPLVSSMNISRNSQPVSYANAVPPSAAPRCRQSAATHPAPNYAESDPNGCGIMKPILE